MSAMLNTLTPMVAQSFEDASLISIGTVAGAAVCELVPPDAMFESDESEDPPPQAVSVATIAPHTAKLIFLVSMSLPHCPCTADRRSDRTVSSGNGVQ